MSQAEEHFRDDAVVFGATLNHSADAGFGKVNDLDFAKIQSRAPALVERDALFVTPTTPSNSNLDSYTTRMSDTTLRNYADDSERGVPVMNTHMRSGDFLPIGRSFAGELVEVRPDYKEVRSKAYMLRDLAPNGAGSLATNDLIRQIESGVITEMSVGFSIGREGKMLCSICNTNNRDWKTMCDHILGKYYDGRMCFEYVENAHLREQSFVYMGSTPNTQIGRMEMLVERGKVSRRDIGIFEDIANVRIMQRFPGISLRDEDERIPQGDQDMKLIDAYRLLGITETDADRLPDDADDLRVIARIKAEIDRFAKQPVVTDETLRSENGELKDRLVKLELKSKRGDAYIDELIKDALNWGVRALGDNFMPESTEKLLRLADDPDVIKGQREQYRAMAEATFGANGTKHLDAASERTSLPDAGAMNGKQGDGAPTTTIRDAALDPSLFSMKKSKDRK